MQIPTLRMQPPPKYGDLKELEAVFSTLLPSLIPHLAEMLGKRSPRLTRKNSKHLKGKLQKFLRTARPYLLGLTALKPGPEQQKSFYALLEGLVKENYRTFGYRVTDDQDAFELMLRHTEREVHSPKGIARFPAYSDTKKATYVSPNSTSR